MSNLRAFMANLWGYVKNHMEPVRQYLLGTVNQSRLKARDCLTRTKNAYMAITHYPVRDQITEHQLDTIVRSARSNQEIPKMLEQAGVYDELYACLLVIAIMEVYRSSSPPELASSTIPRLTK